MNNFINMPGTNDLVNLNHIVAIYQIEDDNYLVALTSGSFTLKRSEYLKLIKTICDVNLHSSVY